MPAGPGGLGASRSWKDAVVGQAGQRVARGEVGEAVRRAVERGDDPAERAVEQVPREERAQRQRADEGHEPRPAASGDALGLAAAAFQRHGLGGHPGVDPRGQAIGGRPRGAQRAASRGAGGREVGGARGQIEQRDDGGLGLQDRGPLGRRGAGKLLRREAAGGLRAPQERRPRLGIRDARVPDRVADVAHVGEA